ncbi:MAG TPA: SCP2 sterol-binding domain-containing protein [Acidimicrobiales bacterium]
MTHQFLSDEWFDAARGIRDKYADQAPPVPYKLRMNQVITANPFGDDDLKLYLDTTDGHMVMEKGELEGPDVTFTTDYETARKIFVEQDQSAAMQAFMSGKIKVQGDMTKLMAMQATPPDDTAKAIAAEIKDITA